MPTLASLEGFWVNGNVFQFHPSKSAKTLSYDCAYILICDQQVGVAAMKTHYTSSRSAVCWCVKMMKMMKMMLMMMVVMVVLMPLSVSSSTCLTCHSQDRSSTGADWLANRLDRQFNPGNRAEQLPGNAILTGADPRIPSRSLRFAQKLPEGSVSQYQSRDWLGRASLKWPILCRVGCETLTSSQNEPNLRKLNDVFVFNIIKFFNIWVVCFLFLLLYCLYCIDR